MVTSTSTVGMSRIPAGGKPLRGPIMPAISLRIMWARMVTSPTTTSVYILVPAGGIFYLKRNGYFALRTSTATAARVICTRVVASTATSTV